MMNARLSKNSGFTLIELILAIGFVSILLLAVSVLTIRVSDMYEKGATVRSINQVGRETMDVLRRDFAQASTGVEFDATGNADGSTYRLCLGDVSYIANSAKLLNAKEEADGGSLIGVVTQDGAGDEGVRLARVVDKGRGLCSTGDDDAMPMRVSEQATDLLTNSTMKLAVHDMQVTQVLQGANQEVYRVTLLVGTNDVGLVNEDNRCRVATGDSENANANFNYCSVAELTTLMRTGGSL